MTGWRVVVIVACVPSFALPAAVVVVAFDAVVEINGAPIIPTICPGLEFMGLVFMGVVVPCCNVEGASIFDMRALIKSGGGAGGW